MKQCMGSLKLTMRWAASFGVAIALSSCAATSSQLPVAGGSSEGSKGSEADAQTDTLEVVTTFLPMTNFAQAVAGDRAQVTQLLPLNIGPHDYQAKPKDAQRLASADLLIQNGLSFESFLSDLIANAGNTDLVIVDASEGIESIQAEDEHSEGEHSEGEHSEGEEHAHEHGPDDPHVWLDPKKAIQQVENIRDALIAADAEGRSVYTANAAAYIKELQALDASISEALAPYTGKTFVTYHDFAAHFAHSYGLEVEHLVNVPEDGAAPADVRRVIEAAKASNLKTLLSEPQQQGSPFDAVAKDLGVAVSVFDPMETSGPEGLDPDYYLTVMNKNLDQLEAAFGKAAP
jgi:zinc transport system substrate-binding protein